MDNILETKVKRDSYIVIQGWMLTDLKLKGNELMVYAIVYGFSKDADGQYFTGSLQYIVDWTNSTKRTVLTCLQSLESKGFIEKKDVFINNVKFCKYRAVSISQAVKNLQGGGEKISIPSEKTSTGGGEKISPNNLALNKLNNNIVNSIVNKPSRFIPPTLEEVRTYCLERSNNVDPERFIDYYTSNGWKVGRNPMKDWKAAVRTWESKEVSKPKLEIVNHDFKGQFDDPSLLDSSQLEQCYDLFTNYVSSKLNRELTPDEEEKIVGTINCDPLDLVKRIISKLDNYKNLTFDQILKVYLDESVAAYSAM